ncbi:translation initiation factor EIF2b gamma subunit [Blastocystis sp. subtype 4]|uniref:translation initiation factor EIF2b gamma subunit n=1 Tax=Blastocystis sp. subtype 4 TaxID=944170 RepID=UPI0007115CA3|nr:translation initiation factor EIF2b gamma subunit [Blastocystis sp. subtype 4]KNB41711.1 translation initiation factor EIF2b gamma subunit [Blastocystis sp. subtype 4]|eukprot:XP_014525154.1 translation initiation factor EIF2b gamma subunit [Blastocystis sp. subtype 4]
MAAVQGFEVVVVIIPNEDECFQPLSKDLIPSTFIYKKDKLGLSYIFEFFLQYHFDSVSVVVGDDIESEQVAGCMEGFEKFVKVVQIDGYKGSADALRKVASMISLNVVVVTGIPNLKMNLLNALDVYRRKECICLIVLEKLNDHKADKNKANPVYGITSDQRILSYADLLVRSKELNIPKALLQDYPSFTLYTNLVDRNIVICGNTFISLLNAIPSADDLKTDFLSTLIRRQHYYRDNEEYRTMQDMIQQSTTDIFVIEV